MTLNSWLLLLALLLAASLGCVKAPQAPCTDPTVNKDLSRCVIEEVDIVGAQNVPADQIEERIATAKSAHVMGGALQHTPLLGPLDRATVDYEYFDRFVLERDLARIERYYRSKGFYEAHASAARVTRRKDGAVRVEIAVAEGPPVTVGRVDMAWKDWSLPLAAEVTKPVTEAKNTLKVESRFDEDDYEKTKRAVLRAMTDRGFAYASVEAHAKVDLTTHQASVLFTLELGPHCTFGDVEFQGLGEIPEQPLRDALGFAKGDEFSTASMDSAQYALANFNVFGAIDVAPKLSKAGEPRQTVVPIVITVQPAALRAIKAGVGAELGRRVQTHAVIGWENRNLFGGLRRFTVEVKPALVLYPTTIFFEEAPQRVLPELKLNVELRQPIPFNTRYTLVLRGEFELAQQLFDLSELKLYRPFSCSNGARDPGETPAPGEIDTGGPCAPTKAAKTSGTSNLPIIGNRRYEGTSGIERFFWNSHVFFGGYLRLQLLQPFSYNDVDPPVAYQSLLIPYAEVSPRLDLRRNTNNQDQKKIETVNPNFGAYIVDDYQFALLGTSKLQEALRKDDPTIPAPGTRFDAKLRLEPRVYLPISRKVTLALRLTAGAIFASGYGGQLADTTPAALRDREKELRIDEDVQLLQRRGFVSGGPYSNRGYNAFAIGPHVFICADPDGSCEQEKVYQLVPAGGLALWEASAEVRVPIAGKFGAAFFLDASDVTRTYFDIRLNHPHISAGVGLRYDTPVGPLRLDVGVRLPCLQVIGVETVDTPDGPQQQCKSLPTSALDPTTAPGVLSEAPEDTLFGLPIAFSLAIGEAY